MKGKVRLTVMVLVVVAGLLLGVGVAVAKEGPVTPYMSTETIPSGDVCEAAGGWIDFDGVCALRYIQPFTPTPDGQHVTASRVSYFRDEASDSRMTGYNTVEANISLNTKTGNGHIWGTWNLVPDGWPAGTGWEGTWNGQLFSDGSSFIVGTARGTGDFEGLFVRFRNDSGMIIEQGG